VPNHPNRSRRDTPAANPTPQRIKTAREAASQTQQEAAIEVHSNLRSWQKWEGGERRMHPAFFELYQIKTGVLQ